MPSLIYPQTENDVIVPIKYSNNNNDDDKWKTIPYRVNGEHYTVKIRRSTPQKTHGWIHVNKPNNANPNILGYANLKSKSLFPEKLELITQDSISQFDYHNGYFEQNRDGEYQICIQLDYESGTKIREICNSFDFKSYRATLTNEDILRQKEEEKEQKRIYIAKRNLEKLVSNYQSNSDDPRLLASIGERIFAWPELHREITVFRGQRDPMVQLIRTAPGRFFSTSLDWFISNQQFTSGNDNCCLFVIHAQPGVKYYSIVGDIDEAIRNYNAVRAGNETARNRLYEREGFEEEVLLEGNGVFYKDKAKTARGFRELSVEELDRLKIDLGERPMTHTRNGKTVTQKTGVFEAYYFPPEAKKTAPGSFTFGGIAAKQGGKRRKSRKQVQKKKRGTRRH